MLYLQVISIPHFFLPLFIYNSVNFTARRTANLASLMSLQTHRTHTFYISFFLSPSYMTKIFARLILACEFSFPVPMISTLKRWCFKFWYKSKKLNKYLEVAIMCFWDTSVFFFLKSILAQVSKIVNVSEYSTNPIYCNLRLVEYLA